MNLSLEMSTTSHKRTIKNLIKIGLLGCASLLNHFQVILRGSSSEYKTAVLCIRKSSFLKLNQSPDCKIKQ